jgi:hypothetical protein
MTSVYACTVLALFAGVIAASCSEAQQSTAPALEHARTEFHFAVQALYEEVFPLFGALEEKKWAEGWNPQFAYPVPVRDQRGMVFSVEHSGRTGVWTCTAFDESAGYVQYVFMLGDVMVTVIDIHLTRASANETAVSVVYERTALRPEANDHVAHFAKGDAKSGPEWAEAINGYLAKARTAPASSK